MMFWKCVKKKRVKRVNKYAKKVVGGRYPPKKKLKECCNVEE